MTVISQINHRDHQEDRRKPTIIKTWKIKQQLLQIRILWMINLRLRQMRLF